MPKRKKAEPETPKVTRIEVESPATLRSITGTARPRLQNHLLDQVYRSLWLPNSLSEEDRVNRIKSAIEILEGIVPRDELEGMLAVQIVATHHAALECLRRAMLPEQTFAGRDQNLKHAAKLLSIYGRQIEGLNKHRGKGQQKVTVEYVNVESGGQAVVGHVETGQTPTVRPRQRRAPAALVHAPNVPLDTPGGSGTAVLPAKVRRKS
jgi:hypothetical protein